MCDLTPSGSDVITHLAYHFVNEEMPQILKNRRIALAFLPGADVRPRQPKKNRLERDRRRPVPHFRIDEIRPVCKIPRRVGFSADLRTSVQISNPQPPSFAWPQDRGFSAGKGVHSP